MDGYQERMDWWLNGRNKFRISSPNTDYPAEYFQIEQPYYNAQLAYFKYVKEYVKLISGKDLTKSDSIDLDNKACGGVVDFGCSGGWLISHFQNDGIATYAYEGSKSGYDVATGRGIKNIEHKDIRDIMSTPLYRYDIALCSEVPEHIEIPFHGILVTNLIKHSDLIWFSTETPEVINEGHIHHPGEMPYEYWISLFEYYNYGCYMFPDNVFQETGHRGKCIFYNKSMYNPQASTEISN